MRAGIVGEITGYPDTGGVESHGQGIEEDAVSVSREFPDQTIRFTPERGAWKWFENGKQIDEPDWGAAS